MPGNYRITVNADGVAASRELIVVNDPRSTASAADLEIQVDAERGLAAAITRLHEGIEALRSLRDAARQQAGSAQKQDVQSGEAAFNDASAAAINAMAANRSAVDQLAQLDQGDAAPTPSTAAAIAATCGRASAALESYRSVIAGDLPALNRVLSAAGLPVLAAAVPPATPACQVK